MENDIKNPQDIVNQDKAILNLELKKLEVFVGKWNMEGQQYEGLYGPAAKVTAVQTYEWLEGGGFLIHRLKGNVREIEIACIEIIGYDQTIQQYPIHSFYNNGKTIEWKSSEKNDSWTLTGNSQVEGKLLKVRCIILLSDSGCTMTGKWEQSDNGSDEWKTFWDVKSIKVK